MVDPLPRQPTDNGEVVFDSPWQARAFAMAVKLNESGELDWKIWTQRFSSRIERFETQGEITSSDDYYRLWLETLEEIVLAKEDGYE